MKRYIEPFVGGGAMFFEIAQKYGIPSAYLYDVNSELILAYRVVQQYPEKLIERLDEISKNYQTLTESKRKELYYTIRERYNFQRLQIDHRCYSADWISRAAMLIFLNRTCFNGLFRLNSKGEFNVPHGRYKNPRILDTGNLMAVSRLLQAAEIRAADFPTCEGAIGPASFVYFDPPYRPISRTASFTSYSTFDFDDQQQVRLACFFGHLDKTYDVKMMLSNSDPTNENPDDRFFESLYGDYDIHKVFAKRMISSNAQKRGQIHELVITNYQTPATGRLSGNAGKSRS